MTNTPTPRSLDPKFKDATVPADQTEETTPAREVAEPAKRKDSKEETSQETLDRLRSTEIPKDPNEGQIVYRQQFVDSAGNVGTKEHGPMPVSEWATYSKENGL